MRPPWVDSEARDSTVRAQETRRGFDVRPIGEGHAHQSDAGGRDGRETREGGEVVVGVGVGVGDKICHGH